MERCSTFSPSPLEGAPWRTIPGWAGFRGQIGLQLPSLDLECRSSQPPKQRQIDLNCKSAYLAVGDCFTFGDEVEDSETWAAHLEEVLNKRVLNAGVGVYGIDQDFLGPELLLDNVPGPVAATPQQ